ncbi:MAG: hypothetical protein ACRDBG_02800 [Waterburya sp.]
MTTKVQVKLTGLHNPVKLIVKDSEGNVRHFNVLDSLEASIEEYVHGGQSLEIVEHTPNAQV